MPKVNRSGQSTVLTLQLLLSQLPPKHRLAAAIAYYTAARIGEVLQLKPSFAIARLPSLTYATRACAMPLPWNGWCW
jgi:hypothetical protein